MKYNIPSQLFYTKTHEWAKKTNDKVKIGLTSYAVEKLGEITYLELKEAGTEVKAGDKIGEVESYKSTEPIYSPVSGKIVKVNIEILSEEQGGKAKYEYMTEDPYGKGWLIEVEPEDFDRDVKNLMNSEQYTKHIEAEE